MSRLRFARSLLAQQELPAMSPLFHRKSEEEKAAEQAAAEARREAAERSEQRAAQSLALIEQGHIPVAAAERLARFTERNENPAPTVFSSDLAVSEWSALARLGVTPITQVMGSSIYHVGWQPTYYNVPTEVRVLSDAYNESRRLALGRLLEEAQACRADAVVAVEITRAPTIGRPARSSSSRSARPCACPRRCATPAGRPP